MNEPHPTRPAPIAWSDPARGQAFSVWLTALAPRHQLRPETLRSASADASFRRYFRVDSAAPGVGSCIVMDAPPAQEDCRPFVKVAGLMAAAQLRVPEVLAWDEGQGFMLLTDLGHQTLLDVIDPARPSANLPRYLQAIDALVAWQLASRPGVLPAYDQTLLQRELRLFPDWYLGQYRGLTLTADQQTLMDSTFEQLVAHNLSAPSVFVHRDFMPRNLMVHPDGPGQPLGVLDFQDAVYGPISYDIASLMRDAFLSWEEDVVLDITVRYWQKASKAGLPVDSDFGEFYRRVEWMGLQRHLKVAGIFARLSLRDGKPKYLADTPRFIGYIRATAGRYRELLPFMRLLDTLEGVPTESGYVFGRI